MAIDQTQLAQLIREAMQSVLADTSSAPAAKPTPTAGNMRIDEIATAKKGTNPKEVVVGISPNFYRGQTETIVDIPHADVVREIMAGIEEEGLSFRFVRVGHTADVAFVAHAAAKLSGSGIGIGVIARGTTVIHQRDLAPLSNLELFPQAPLLDRETFRAIGKNAARYAKGESPDPVPVRNDQMARPRYQAVAALMHNKETQLVDLNSRPVELKIEFR